MAAEVNSTKPLEKSEHLSSSNYFFFKSQEEGTLPNLFSEASLTLTPKPDKDLAKIKLQANVTDEQTQKSSTKEWQTGSDNKGSDTMVKQDLSQGRQAFSGSADQSA